MQYITDTESEQRVLSGMLHSDTACVESLNTLSADDFSVPTHATLYTLSRSIYQKGAKPTYAELVREMMDIGELNRDTIQEVAWINEQYITDQNIKYWIDRVRKASKGRKFQRLMLQYQEQINSNNPDVDGIINRLSMDALTLLMDTDEGGIESGQDIANLGIEMVQANVDKWRAMQDDLAFTGQVPLEGVPTGIPSLDILTLGYKPGDLIILGAETGHGKTAFAINTANAVCVESQNRLLYINTEMSPKQIAYRWGSILSQIPLHQIRVGSLRDGEKYQVETGYKLLAKSGFYTAYTPNLTPNIMTILGRKAKLQTNMDMIILDYVGRMDKADPRLQEWQVLEQIIKTQKLLAQTLDVASMVLVQLNEDGSLQGAKRMKNECDLMLKLLPTDEDTADEMRRIYKKDFEPFNYRLYIDKARDGQAGLAIPLVFDKDRQIIREAIIRDGK